MTLMGLKHHQHADNTQLYFALRASHYKDNLIIIEKCTSVVQDLFLINDLLLNPTKLDVVAVGTATGATLPSARVRLQSLKYCHPAPHYQQRGYRCSRWSTATQRRTTISAGTVAIAGAPLITSARSAYKSTRICRLMREPMQFAGRLTSITAEPTTDPYVIICRPTLQKQ